ncbi:hypothetical protein CKM354_000085100 [Cercospora kikuchii]|uniref:Sialidase n=1 Tax=Cercospora kikuchii TaxID=84275 RepID=A0A9P3CC84_9PEZI|nr:uncharacterized protein CKM354_000085100 [Cercospora kikuchii]GIZ37405.1 hypothetical protein CKM354_000085100 [Cercospora kikuchii]
MDFRHVTPPSEIQICGYDDLPCPGGSASTDGTYFPQDWSPQTTLTAATTPPRSPGIIRENGSRLLPKPRYQDQVIEPSYSRSSAFYSHHRTSSLPVNPYGHQFGPALPHPSVDRRSTSPYAHARTVSVSPQPTSLSNPLGISRPSMSNMRSASSSHISNVRSHSRNMSSSSIDAAMLSRYGYPTYRQSPNAQPLPVSLPASRPPTAMSFLAPIIAPNGQMQSYPNQRRTASPPARPSRLSVEAEVPVPSDVPSPTSTVLDYLTEPNPAPSLIKKITKADTNQVNHFWFDIRNVRPWTDFTVDTISSIPGLLDLLKIDVSMRALPKPGQVNLSPETPAQLAELCAMHHAVKVNAALKVAQGDKHIAMRALRSGLGARQQPEFVANYQSDGEKTIYGDGRGRVVGIVKSYDQWNSGYRNGSPIDKIKYLEHLSHLHRFMREHGTRYGFIMTEIELVCVRAGGPPASSTTDIDNNSNPNIPLFGYLEIGPSVQISASASPNPNINGSALPLTMTADLALWYLHMLAKEQPFPGQFNWKLEVGGPTALTRRHHLPRDDWMPKVNQQDKRVSKRIRGWTWPDEPLHKRECGNGRARGRR